MASYNPFKDDSNDQPRDNWFIKTATAIGTIYGAKIAYQKMMGPHGKLLEYFTDKAKDKEIARAIDKYIGKTDSIYQSEFWKTGNNDIDYSELKRIGKLDEFTEGIDRSIVTSDNVRRNIYRMEWNIFRFLSRGINFPNGSDRTTRGFLAEGFLSDSSQREDLLRESKRVALTRFFAEERGIDSGDFDSFLNNGGYNKGEASKQIDALHDKYLLNPKYAKLYKGQLRGITRQAILSAKNKPFSYNEKLSGVKNFLYTSTFNPIDSEIISDLAMVAKNKKMTMEKVDIREKLSSLNGYVSDLTSKGRAQVDPNTFASAIQNFDYNEETRELVKTLNKLETKGSISSFKIEYIKGERRYISVTIESNMKSNVTFNVPIARDGVYDSSSRRIDKLFKVSSGYLGDAEVINSTKAVLRELSRSIDSAVLNELDNDPAKFEAQVKNRMNKIVQQLSIVTGAERDYTTKLGSIVDTDTYDTMHKNKSVRRANLSRLYSAGFESAHTLRRLNQDKNAIVVALDIETLSRGDIGPQVSINDYHTQIWKAGINVAEKKSTGGVMTQFNELTSDHGIDYFRNHGVDLWESELRSGKGIRKLTTLFTGINDPVKSAAAFQEMVKKEAHPGIKNNQQFAEKIIDQLVSVVNKATDEGKTVYLTTSNGATFDLPILRNFAPEKFEKLQKALSHNVGQKNLFRHIDVHSIDAMLKGTGEYGSLSMNKVLQRILSSHGVIAPLDIDGSNPKEALKQLKHKVKGKFLLDFMDGIIPDNVKAHWSPGADNVGTLYRLFNHLNSGDISDLDEKIEKVIRKYSSFNKRVSIQSSVNFYRTLEGVNYNVNGQVYTSTFGNSTSGMSSKFVASLISPQMLLGSWENPVGKQWHQLYSSEHSYRPSFMSSDSKVFKNEDLKQRWFNRTHNPIQTKEYLNIMGLMRGASDDANYYSHHVMAKTAYLWNAYRGTEGFVSMSRDMLSDFTATVKKVVNISGDNFIDDPVMNSKMQSSLKQIIKMAKESAKDSPLNSDHIQQAAKDFFNDSRNGEWIVKRATVLAKGDMANKISKKMMNGKVTNIFTSFEDNIPKIHAEITYEADGLDIGTKYAGTARMFGAKAHISMMDKTLSEYMAHYGIEAVASADFLEKGYIGSFNQIMSQKLVWHYMQDRDKNGNITPESKRKLKRLAFASNGVWDDSRQMIITGSNKQTKRAFERYTKRFHKNENANVVGKFFGESFVSFDFLMSEISKHGGGELIHNQDTIRKYYQLMPENNIKQSINEMVDKQINKLKKQTSSGVSVLGDLEQLKVEYTRRFEQIFLPRVGDARLVEPLKVGVDSEGNDRYELGTVGRDMINIYGLDDGNHVGVKFAKIQNYNLDTMIFKGGHMTKSMQGYILRNRGYVHSRKLYEAKNKYQMYRDSLMSGAIARNGSLSLEELRYFGNREGLVGMAEEIKRDLSSNSEKIKSRMAEKLNQIAEDDTVSFTKINEDIDTINEIFKSKERKIDKLKESFRFISVGEANKLTELGRKYGDNGRPLLSISPLLNVKGNVTKGGVFTLDINEAIKHSSDIIGGDIEKVKNNILDLYSQALEKSKKLGKSGFIHSVDKNQGKITFNELILDGDETVSSTMDKLVPTLGVANEETRLKFRVIEAASVYSSMVQNGSGKENLVAQEKLLSHQYFKYIVNSFGYSKSSLGYLADQMQVPGLYTSFKTSESVLAAAANYNPKYLHPNEVKTVDKLLRSDIQTGIVTKSLFEKMVTEVDGKTIRVAEHLKKTMGEDLYNKTLANGDPIHGAGFLRYPIAQAGKDGIFDMKFSVIDDELANKIGMDKNTFYAHSLLMKMVHADNDDHAFILFKSYLNNKSHLDYSKESSESLKTILGNTHIREEINSFNKANHIVSFLDKEGESYARVAQIDPITGEIKHDKLIKSSELKLDDMVSSLSKFAVGSVDNTVKNISVDNAKRLMTAGMFSGISKNMIGRATSLYNKRVTQLLMSGSIDAKDIDDFIGNVKYGFAAFTQSIIDFAKHDTSEIPKISSALDFLENPKRNDAIGKKHFIDLFSNGYKTDELKQKAIGIANTIINKTLDIDEMRVKNKSLSMAVDIKNSTHFGQQGTNGVSRMLGDVSDFTSDITKIRDELLEKEEKKMRALFDSSNQTQDFFTALGKRMEPHVSFGEGKGISRKVGIGAMAFLALNFFRPNQLSSSSNPLDGFIDLGIDSLGNNNIFSTGDQYRDGGVPIVNPSFSESVRISLNSTKKDDQSRYYNAVTRSGMQKFSSRSETEKDGGITYTDYTTNIGYFANSSLSRKMSR